MYCLLPPYPPPCGPFCPGCEYCYNLVFCGGEPQGANAPIRARIQPYDDEDRYANAISQAIDDIQKRTEGLQRKLASMEEESMIRKRKRKRSRDKRARRPLAVRNNEFKMDASSADPFESLESRTNYGASECNEDQRYDQTENRKGQSQTSELPVPSSHEQINNIDMMQLCLAMMGEVKTACNELATVVNRCLSVDSQSAWKFSTLNINQRDTQTTADAPTIIDLPSKPPVQCDRTSSICTTCCAISRPCCSKFPLDPSRSRDRCPESTCKLCLDVSDRAKLCSKPRGSKCKNRCECGKPCRICRKPSEKCACSAESKSFFQDLLPRETKRGYERLHCQALPTLHCRKSCCCRKACCTRERNNCYASSYGPVKADLIRRRYPKTRSVKRTWCCWSCF